MQSFVGIDLFLADVLSRLERLKSEMSLSKGMTKSDTSSHVLEFTGPAKGSSRHGVGRAIFQQGGLKKRFPDGRACKLCSCHDTDWDPLDGEPIYIWWGYSPIPETGATKGDYCYYCVRVHIGRYKHEMTISELKLKIGAAGDEMKKFKGFRSLCIEKIVVSGMRDIRCPWQDFRRTLDYEEKTSLDVLYPEDDWLPLAEYIEEFGNPLTNGKNHTAHSVDNVAGYLVPSGKRIKIQRRKSQSIKQTTRLDDTVQHQLGDDQIQQKYNSIQNSFFNMFRSSGASMASMMASQQPSQTQADGVSASSGGNTSASASAGSSRVGSAFGSASGACGSVGGLLASSTFFGATPSAAPLAEKAEQAGSAPSKGARRKPTRPVKREVDSPSSVRVPAESPQSKSSGAGGEQNSGKKKLGRPARNLHSTVQAEATALQTAQKDCDKIFGSASQQYAAYLRRLIKDISNKQIGSDDPDEYAQLTSAQKRVEVWLEVLVAHASFGTHSMNFQTTWDEQRHFAELEPVVPWDFPQWLCHARLENKVLSISEPIAFWKNIATASLEAEHFNTVAETQERLLSEKIALFSCAASTFVASLKSFYHSQTDGGYPICEGLQKQCVSVHMVANHPSLSYKFADRLKQAIDDSNNVDFKVVHALTLYPDGRSLLKASVKIQATLAVLSEEIKSIKHHTSIVMTGNLDLSAAGNEVDKFFEGLFSLNKVLFDLRNREELPVAKDRVVEECQDEVLEASAKTLNAVMEQSCVVVKEVLALSADADTTDIEGYDNLYEAIQSMSKTQDVYSEQWGWALGEAQWRCFKSVETLVRFIWKLPELLVNGVNRMSPDDVAAAMGSMDAAMATKTTLVEVWGDECGALIDQYFGDAVVVRFKDEAGAILSDAMSSQLMPLQDLSGMMSHRRRCRFTIVKLLWL